MIKKIEKLRETNPEISISTHFECDADYQWDGDGPNPSVSGLLSYTTEVRASTIHNGQLFTGSSYLAGVYAKPGEIDAEIDGYLDQLIDEAVARLATVLDHGYGYTLTID